MIHDYAVEITEFMAALASLRKQRTGDVPHRVFQHLNQFGLRVLSFLVWRIADFWAIADLGKPIWGEQISANDAFNNNP